MDDQTRSGRWANWGRALRALLLGPRRDVLAHPVDGRWPRVPLEIVPDIAPTPTDVAHAERLLAAFARCRASGATERREGQSDLWTEIRQRQATFFGVLDAGDPAALAAYLCNMNRHDATTGTVQGDGEYRRLRRSPRYRRFLAHMAKDKLVSLAEAVGAIPCENPEQGTWGQNIHRDHDQLVGAIEATLGLEITPPPIDGGLLKMRTSRGLFNERDLNALYTAWNVRQYQPRESSPFHRRRNAAECPRVDRHGHRVSPAVANSVLAASRLRGRTVSTPAQLELRPRFDFGYVDLLPKPNRTARGFHSRDFRESSGRTFRCSRIVGTRGPTSYRGFRGILPRRFSAFVLIPEPVLCRTGTYVHWE